LNGVSSSYRQTVISSWMMHQLQDEACDGLRKTMP